MTVKSVSDSKYISEICYVTYNTVTLPIPLAYFRTNFFGTIPGTTITIDTTVIYRLP